MAEGGWVRTNLADKDTSCRNIFTATCWTIWNARYDFVFNGMESSTEQFLRQATMKATEISSSNMLLKWQNNKPLREDVSGWSPPLEGWLKFNCNAT
ncbi:OLC1v1031572C1, partial [Oldenlandia corymbosa var. corymbosa]